MQLADWGQTYVFLSHSLRSENMRWLIGKLLNNFVRAV